MDNLGRVGGRALSCHCSINFNWTIPAPDVQNGQHQLLVWEMSWIPLMPLLGAFSTPPLPSVTAAKTGSARTVIIFGRVGSPPNLGLP